MLMVPGQRIFFGVRRVLFISPPLHSVFAGSTSSLMIAFIHRELIQSFENSTSRTNLIETLSNRFSL